MNTLDRTQWGGGALAAAKRGKPRRRGRRRPTEIPGALNVVLTLTVGADWTGVTLAPLPEEDFAGDVASASAATTTVPESTTTTAKGATTSMNNIGSDMALGKARCRISCASGVAMTCSRPMRSALARKRRIRSARSFA